jgi:peptidoglycan-associated lipoprotein
MRKKMFPYLIVMAFVCSVLLTTGCAKKSQYMGSEGVGKSTELTKAQSQAGQPGKDMQMQKVEEFQKEQKRKFGSSNIYFDFDEAVLKSEAKENLNDKADWLQENPSFTITIEGYCDERGTNEYNLALGERRAHSAKRYLSALGIAENRIDTISYGEERPADPGHNEAAWALNRRDEFKTKAE